MFIIKFVMVSKEGIKQRKKLIEKLQIENGDKKVQIEKLTREIEVLNQIISAIAPEER